MVNKGNSMKKHICFINSAFSRDDALIVHRQGASLIRAGYRVSYLMCDGLPDDTKNGIEIKSVGRKAHGIRERVFENSRIFKQFLQNYHADIYQISEPELLPLGLYLKRKGNTVIYNLREYYPDYYARKVKNGFVRKIIFKLCERYLSYCTGHLDGLLNCMPEMREYIERVMPCRYFADVANFPVVNKDFNLSYYEYASRKKIISYFGSIYTISCQEEFLEALQDFPEVRYLLAGVFYTKEYKEVCEKMPAWKQVDFVDGFTREELPGIINSSIIGNVVKDFGQTETPEGSYSIIKIFETMEAAVPVILAKVPLYEKMVEKYHCGICVHPHSVEDFRNAIRFLLENPEVAYEMGQNGRRAVLEEFSWDSQEENYLYVINELSKEA